MNELDTLNPVFIVGTGRCGTTVMARILSEHPDIFTATNKEFRLLIDPDGFLSLKKALVDDWSPYNASTAVIRFNKMIVKYSTHFRYYPTLVTFRQILGRKNWDEETKKLLDNLSSFKYKGAWAGNSNIIGKTLIHYLGLRKLNPFLGKIHYHGPMKEREFFQLARDFLINLFRNHMKVLYKKIWVDHSPQACIHADFILKMFPEAKFLYLYRDPRDVVSSYKTRDWAPNSTYEAAIIVRDILLRWKKVKQSIPTRSYKEIKFETLISDSSRLIEEICDWLGIEANYAMKNYDLSKSNQGRWRKDLSEKDKEILRKSFSDLLAIQDYA